MFILCTRSAKHSKWHCSGDEKQINDESRNIKLNLNHIIKVSATANAINNNKCMFRLQNFRQVTGLPRCVHRLSDKYLEYASESPYSVQNMANIRIRLIFDSSNTLVNRLSPSSNIQLRSSVGSMLLKCVCKKIIHKKVYFSTLYKWVVSVLMLYFA